NDQLFARPVDAEAGLPAAIADSLELTDSDKNSVRLYAPLASGFHVDHQHVFNAGAILARQGFDVWFYEDLPYSLSPDRLQARLDDLDGGMEVASLVDVGSVWTKKIDAIMAYPSQLKVIFESYVGAGSSREAIDQVMSEYSKEAGGGRHAERFWQLAS
ncbi:MAG: hypothetical protein KC438_12415, partial [Thermomicrobiales bacterium]|nr:hypothetical protein [Thermomicrobiales bacterium]